ASFVRIQLLLQEMLEALSYEVIHIPGQQTGGHLLAREIGGRDKPHQLLLGHCDTVWPPNTLETMPLEIDGNIMRGPGVYDMKAGLVQMLWALKTIRELGVKTAVSPVIFINSDEEIGSPESRTTIIELAQQVDRAFVIEPAIGPEGKLKTARKGVARFQIHITGKAAHAGNDPENGVSAILALSHIVQTLFALNDPEKGITVNVGVVKGGVQSNVVAPESEALVDVRAVKAADAARIEAEILQLQPPMPGIKLEVTGGFNRPPMERTAGTEQLWQLAVEFGRALGIELAETIAGGGSDGNLTNQYTPTLDGLGAVGDGAHAPHEFINLDKMVERTALLVNLLLAPPLSE
ncbi:MAG: M20 family peptidase, partial [Chloroflexi bacterium]